MQQTNYIEFSLPLGQKLVYDDGEIEVYETDMEQAKKQYESLYSRVCNGNQQPRIVRQFEKDDVIYTFTPPGGDITVYSLTPLYRDDNSKLQVTAYEKKKLSIINMQCTTDYDDVSIVSRTTMRISNRVFINFEVKNDTNHRVYINYNHDQKVDWTVIQKDLARAFRLVGTTY